MRNVVVLAEDAAEVTAGEEDSTGATVPLDIGFLAIMRGDGVDLGGRGVNEAVAGFLIAVHAAEARVEVTVEEVGVGCGAFSRCRERGEVLVAGGVVIEEDGWCEVEVSMRRRRRGCGLVERWPGGYPGPFRQPRHRRGKTSSSRCLSVYRTFKGMYFVPRHGKRQFRATCYPQQPYDASVPYRINDDVLNHF